MPSGSWLRSGSDCTSRYDQPRLVPPDEPAVRLQCVGVTPLALPPAGSWRLARLSCASTRASCHSFPAPFIYARFAKRAPSNGRCRIWPSDGQPHCPRALQGTSRLLHGPALCSPSSRLASCPGNERQPDRLRRVHEPVAVRSCARTLPHTLALRLTFSGVRRRLLVPARAGRDCDHAHPRGRYNLTRRTSDGILLTVMAKQFPDASPSWREFTEFPQCERFAHTDIRTHAPTRTHRCSDMLMPSTSEPISFRDRAFTAIWLLRQHPAQLEAPL